MRTNVIALVALFVAIVGAIALAADPPTMRPEAAGVPGVTGSKGLQAMFGLSDNNRPENVVKVARDTGCAIYFQSADPAEVAAVRKAADAAGVLGKWVFADQGDLASIHLADNLIDKAFDFTGKVTAEEGLRVVRPRGYFVPVPREHPNEKTTLNLKSPPAGLDAWSHPYHGPDNNPQSSDQVARAPYLTQYVAAPEFGCMPEVTVAAGGRVFRAFGHIAFREYQNAAINTLTAVNAYNGTILWTRPLRPGFMIHRNTMVATADTLYLADDESCKLFDAATGKVAGEIVAPREDSDGPVWKWMALEGGVLYGLVGGEEVKPPVQRGRDATIGGWPWGMWPGYEYKDPKTAWGFGRTFLAVDVKTKKVLWTHREQDYIDSRGTCMRGGKIYCYSPGNFLASLNAKTGQPAWKNSAADLLAAIGPNGRAQGFLVGFATSTYIKAHDQGLFFAGPQRPKLVAAALDSGKLLWQKEDGNRQLVLRDDAIYAAGVQGKEQSSVKLDYATGRELARFPDRRACTRATGSIDSIFYRAKEGTVRLDVAAGVTEHIASMRPPCNSGVIVSEGLLHWGPWICGCRLSLFGDICLAPAGNLKFDFHPKYDDSRLALGPGGADGLLKGVDLKIDPAAAEWGCFRPNLSINVAVPGKVKELWTYQPATPGRVTPAVAAGDFVFVGGEDGVVRALGAADGKLRWQAYTGGAILSPPTIWRGRVFVGSADGWLYSFEAGQGRLLWRYRVAPAERWIPVFGKIQSTWPVAGGAAVDGSGVVYAAAGMAHYDGTYVVALDAATGKLKWCNDSAGSLSKVRNGVSPHGPLYLDGGDAARLCFAGGNVYPVAQFDTRTGKCLNAPVDSETSSAYDLFYNPDSIQGLLRVPLGDGRGVVANNGNGKLTLVQKGGVLPEPGQGAPQGPQVGLLATYRAFLLADNVLLAAGSRRPAATPIGGASLRPVAANSGGFALVAADFKDGKAIWSADLNLELPAAPVPNGLIATGGPPRPNRIIVSLTDGRVVCFGAAGN